LLLLLLLAGIAQCKKDSIIIPDQNLVHFQNQTSGSYFIQNDPASEFKVPVGVLVASDQPRNVTYTVSSPTGAAAGTQYSIFNTGTVTIPAGSTTAFIPVKGNFSAYPTGRRDTLRFTITGGDIPAAEYNKSYDLILQKYCTVDINSFAGVYAQTREMFSSAYGPYTTSISSITPTGANKARIVVNNIFNAGWGPIEFDLDWNDPANFKATVVAKSSGIANGSTISATYAGQQVAVRPYAGNDGTFSSCDGTLTLRMQLGIAGLGWFSPLYTVTMAR
jgi:hypothetical protein